MTQPSAQQSNSKQYALRKIRKYAPELHERVIAGEMSANKAMIEAGFRGPPPEPLEKLQRAWNQATQQERDDFMEWIQG